MATQILPAGLFEDWLAFTRDRAVMECSFFPPAEEKVKELLGVSAGERLTAFGRHASGSLLALYLATEMRGTTGTTGAPAGEVTTTEAGRMVAGDGNGIPVAWLDGEGTPCVVISSNLREFLSILPYGPGWIYTAASVISNNPEANAADLLGRVNARAGADYPKILAEAEQRHLDVGVFRDWLAQKGIGIASDPAALIVAAYGENKDLESWIIKINR